MPKRDESKYNVSVKGEPTDVKKIRTQILDAFDGLEFVDEGHKYFLNGEELRSVSSVAQEFEEEFDTENKAKAYAEKNGMTPEYWIDQWKFTNLKATISGTQTHAFAESLGWMHMGHPENIVPDQLYKYVEDKGWLIPTRPKECAAIKFWENFPPNMYVVLPETKIYNIGEVYKYAGTFDLLTYYDHPTDKSKSGVIIMDWKTNREIRKDYSRENGKMMKYPFGDLFMEPFGVYTIQLNLYALALEKIGIKVIGKRIVWLKDDESFEIIKVPDVEEKFMVLDKKLLA